MGRVIKTRGIIVSKFKKLIMLIALANGANYPANVIRELLA